MKRFNVWIIILLLLFVSIGNDSSIEISDRTLVHAVGIDEDDSGCTVTLQIFKSDGAGSDTQIDPANLIHVLYQTQRRHLTKQCLCVKNSLETIFL